MSEAQWSPDPAAAPVKKSVPKWVWFCGGGCLLAILAGLVVAIFAFQFVQSGRDEEVSWPALQAVLPYDERPAGVQILFYKHIFGMESFTIADDQGLQHSLTVMRGPKGVEGRKNMFGQEKPDMPEEIGPMDLSNSSKGTLEVQGRELAVLRQKIELTGIVGKLAPEEVKKQLQSIVYVDATPEGFDGMVLMQTQRAPHHGSAAGGEITDDELRNFLGHFHLGPKR